MRRLFHYYFLFIFLISTIPNCYCMKKAKKKNHNNCNANDSSWWRHSQPREKCAKMRQVCGRHRQRHRRHIEDVCSLAANAYSKSVLDSFTIHTRASRCPSPSLFHTSVARAVDEEKGGKEQREEVPMQQPREETLLQKVETMQNYPHALINRKKRHSGIVFVGKRNKRRENLKTNYWKNQH